MGLNFRSLWNRPTAVLCSVLLIPATVPLPGRSSAGQQDAAANEAAKIPSDQLDSLVAPIALYPDPLLAQVLAASTYPLELTQLKQWLEKNGGLKDKALTDAVGKQDWDASVQAMAALPDVVKLLTDDVKWTTELGNAFLAQQSDVMDAVQRMRSRAKDAGNLKSTQQQKVETKVVENKSVVVIEQADPQVVYVPSYNPTVVYGPPAYPYPPISYPPPGYYAAGMAISFGVGMAMGAAWGGGGWGWGCGWGGNNDITINTNNNFVRNSNRQSVNAGNRTGNNTWQHNPQHRGGTPYGNRQTANKYGGNARGDSLSSRQANARQNQAQTGARQQAGGTRANQGQGSNRQQPSAGNRAASGAGGGGTDRSRSGGANNGGGSRGGSGGGGDRIGDRSVSPSTGGGSKGNAFGGGSGGMSGSSARASSSRGASSMGRSGGGRRR